MFTKEKKDCVFAIMSFDEKKMWNSSLKNLLIIHVNK